MHMLSGPYFQQLIYSVARTPPFTSFWVSIWVHDAVCAQMRPRAKVVVMDARGSKRAVRLARTLLASGMSQAFIVQVLALLLQRCLPTRLELICERGCSVEAYHQEYHSSSPPALLWSETKSEDQIIPYTSKTESSKMWLQACCILVCWQKVLQASGLCSWCQTAR